MDVPQLLSVTAGLLVVLMGGGILALLAVWWSWASDGISLPRERWPGALRLAAAAGWGLFVAGILLQLIGYFGPIGVGDFAGMGH